MTAFFVGGLANARGSLAEDAYGELREVSQELAGCPARARRIFQLRCRLDGADAEIEVGKAIPSGSGVVSAIIDHGRHEPFVIHTAPADGGAGQPLRVPHPVYAVTEFSAAG
jgi:hypothetical protein